MAEVEDLVRDAEDMIGKAIEEVEIDLRDAAEKAWCATVGAIDALILKKTGVKPVIAKERREKLGELILKEPEIDRVRIWDRYHSRAQVLHAQCFYGGACEPEELIKKKIAETRDYIEDVKKFL